MPLLPHPKREEFDRVIHEEFDKRLERRASISDRLKIAFEQVKGTLTEKVRGQIHAKLEVGMKPDARKEAADVFEFWLSEFLLSNDRLNCF